MPLKKKTTFSALLPPPNLTGVLHLGHIWNATLQDFYIRFNRYLLKLDTSWSFGVDHAGISLQIKFEKDLKESGINPSSLNREEYQTQILQWKEKHKEKILSQYSSMSFCIDYKNSHYTMDDFSVKYSNEKFKQLYDQGLIYQAKKLVNWDTQLNTAISDIEVVFKEVKGSIYYIKYFFTDACDGFLEVATTRPETIFADVALFVNPVDPRYLKAIGKKVTIPYINRTIQVFSDPSIDKDFGTGVMKCTPAHDLADWSLGEKYSLKVLQAFNESGIMSDECGDLSSLTKSDAKEKLINTLLKRDQIRIEEYVGPKPHSERSGGLIEPTLSTQWFLKASVLAKNALDSGLFKQWEWCKQPLLNMHDWCISRQIKWGIQFPIYTCVKTGEVICSLEKIEGDNFVQIEDRLDTWFTSSLWPLILATQHKENHTSNDYIFDFLVTGRDIVLFWVCKMILMCYHFSEKSPFNNVLLHGLILTPDGKKMSKSLNNGITPEQLLEKYGSDVIRLFLASSTHGCNDIKYLESKILDGHKFLHKLENSYKFFQSKNLLSSSTLFDAKKLSWFEKHLLFSLKKLETKLQIHQEKRVFKIEHLNIFEYYTQLKKWLITSFCDVYIELIKINLKLSKDLTENSKKFNTHLWKTILFFLNPIVPVFSESKLKEIFSKPIHRLSLTKSTAKCSQNNNLWFYQYVNYFNKLKHILETNNNTSLSVNLLISDNIYDDFVSESSEITPYFLLLNQEIKDIVKLSESKKTGLTWSFLWSKNDQPEIVIIEIVLPLEKKNLYIKHINKQIKHFTLEVERSKKILNNTSLKDKSPSIYQIELDKFSEYSRQLTFYTSLENAIFND